MRPLHVLYVDDNPADLALAADVTRTSCCPPAAAAATP